ncbi:NAD-dependent protein deacetylase [Brachybacterium sp. AOP25-B2-12]|uniref:NAD-dependent protein deacetylase n=1 Tax=Brachybacterium sp. AOP25-B2-12 TaxID=3457710 RepID=UPI0040332B2B
MEDHGREARHSGDRAGTDVGRWFASAGAVPRSTIRLSPWGPDPRGGYGVVSSAETVRAALSALTHTRPAVLTGAGVSTGSGLPDYRGVGAVPRTPMSYQEFIGSDLARRRYWARSTVGWVAFSRARPGAAHRRLARLGPSLRIGTVITQNVDGLHQRAGSSPVIDLHGRLDRVRCLACGTTISRGGLHDRLLAMNPAVARQLPELAVDAARAPDGDAEVDRTSTFRYPPCAVCGGMLKPDVVFFGESARPEDVRAAHAGVRAAGSLLVLGSSLTVMSGLRFVRAAAAAGRPVVVINDGPTRADGLASERVHGRVEDVLAAWMRDLGLGPDRAALHRT